MPFLFDEERRMIRKDGTLVENTQKGRSKSRGPRKTVLEGGRRISHMKVDRILGGDTPMREEYERLLENPNTLLKDLAAWFAARGHHVNLTSLNRHRHRHIGMFQKVREAAKMAAGFCELMRKSDPEKGPGVFVDAAQGRFEMLLMQDLFEMKDNPALEPGEWQKWAKAVNGAVTTRRSLDEMRAEFERKAKEAAAAVEAMKPGESNERVVARVKEILGV